MENLIGRRVKFDVTDYNNFNTGTIINIKDGWAIIQQDGVKRGGEYFTTDRIRHRFLEYDLAQKTLQI